MSMADGSGASEPPSEPRLAGVHGLATYGFHLTVTQPQSPATEPLVPLIALLGLYPFLSKSALHETISSHPF